ncbi:MAG TPA: sulfotransferase [Rubrobacter sp.]|nr:sulfotransferase [Rubrobacter sp.]
MPVFRHPKVSGVVRRIRATLGLEAGVTRGALVERTGNDGRSAGGVTPENMIWIFGTGRTGSTWLAAMMEEPEGHDVWFEPRVGTIFDPQRFQRHGGKHFILASQYKDVWLRSIRNFILDGADARFPELGGGYLAVKEPGGSVGAGLIMEALPESGMVLLIRDPRDVVASWLDATRKGGWQTRRRGEGGRRAESLAETNPNAFVRRHAEAYLQHVGSARRAYEAHEGRKVVVRYEDLRADTLGTIKRMYGELNIPIEEAKLAKAVEKHAWENIPEEEKGRGMFYRKATPEAWREDLTRRQVKTVERITAPLLEEFYPTGPAEQQG